jgi:hypothetical protein
MDEVAQRPPRPPVRRPSLVAGLSFVTLGIYTFFWYYRVNREMQEFGRWHRDAPLRESNPTASLLAFIPGSLVIVPPIVSFRRAVGRAERCERICGLSSAGGGAIVGLFVAAVAAGLVLGLIPSRRIVVALATVVTGGLASIACALLQQRLNVVWTRAASHDEGLDR